MKRREFTAFLGAAAATWPFATLAQQPAMPIIGLLSGVPFETRRKQIAAFHQGLKEAGYVEGQNVVIEYRSADNQVDRLPTLAADLVTKQVNVSEVTIQSKLPNQPQQQFPLSSSREPTRPRLALSPV